MRRSFYNYRHKFPFTQFVMQPLITKTATYSDCNGNCIIYILSACTWGLSQNVPLIPHKEVPDRLAPAKTLDGLHSLQKMAWAVRNIPHTRQRAN